MSTSNIHDIKNIHFKNNSNKYYKKEKINIKHLILNRNNANKISKLIDKKNDVHIFNYRLYKKNKLSPYKAKNNKLLSFSLLNNANENLEKPKKFILKSPLSILKGVQSNSFHNVGNNRNMPLLQLNINKMNNGSMINNQQNIEYNSINCIINNFNLSCKNVDFFEKKNNKKSDGIIKYKIYYEFFNKSMQKIKDNNNILKKNKSMSYYNNRKNISHLSDANNSFANNISSEDIKVQKIIIKNKQKKEKIKEIYQENKKRMIYLKELEKKCKRLKNDYKEIKIKHMEYFKSIERLLKFLRVLKNSGVNIEELMDNISSGEDYDEYIEDENEESDDTEEQKNETVLSDGSILSNLKQLSSGLLRSHEKYSKGSKLVLKLKNIPLLNLCKLKKKVI